ENRFIVKAENGKSVEIAENEVRGESTMPDRFRYLTKEAPDNPVRWPWFIESSTSSSVLQSPPTLIDSSHPLYVHPSDNPGVLLVSVPFSGTGYTSWRKNVLIALSAKNKAELISGRIPQPSPTSPLYDYWVRCNDMVFAWLSNSLSKDIAGNVLHCDTARDLWRDIEERYGQSSASRYYQIQREIAGVSQGSSNIASYYTRLRKLWDELRTVAFGPACTCGAEPQCSDAYSILLHDESQREIQPSGGSFLSESASFSVKSTSAPAQFTNGPKSFPQKVNFDIKRTTIVCKYYKKTGHSVDKCYKLHGFSSDFKFTKGRKSVACAQVDTSASEDQQFSENITNNHVHGFSKE
uniref:Retrotransposon Copia-like N-terminal domain-containing protein n=1 Tax=Nicotiana tabacum TaxID=4097 RepID=A0A1S4CWJ8_TOBAC